MTTTDREIETIAFYAAQLAALATDLRTTREDLKRAVSDRDAYGEGLHGLGARVAGLQSRVLELEKERDEAKARVAELEQKASGSGYPVPPELVETLRRGLTDGGFMGRARVAGQNETTQEGTGAAPPAVVDPAQRVTAPETPTRAEPAGRSVQSNNEQKEESSQAAEGNGGAGTSADAAPATSGPSQTATSDAGATPAQQESEQRAEQDPGAPATEPAAVDSERRADQCPACGHSGLSRDRIGGACPAVSGSDGKGGCPDPLAWLRSQGEMAAGELSDERIAFRPAILDPFMDEPAPKGPAPVAPPGFLWGTAGGTIFHLFRPNVAEAECGEVCDGAVHTVADPPPANVACMDCAAKLNPENCACEPGSRCQNLHHLPEEPPEAVDTEEPDADEGAPSQGRRYARKPRTCLVPGCEKPGKQSTNEHGARDCGGRWCEEHMKALTVEERREIYGMDRKLKRESKRKAKPAGEAA